MGESFPWLLDSILCIGIILHGMCISKPEFNSSFLSLTGIPIRRVRLYFIYLIAGYWSYFSGLALAPYGAIYAMAAVGGISFPLQMLQRSSRDKKEATYGGRKHAQIVKNILNETFLIVTQSYVRGRWRVVIPCYVKHGNCIVPGRWRQLGLFL